MQWLVSSPGRSDLLDQEQSEWWHGQKPRGRLTVQREENQAVFCSVFRSTDTSALVSLCRFWLRLHLLNLFVLAHSLFLAHWRHTIVCLFLSVLSGLYVTLRSNTQIHFKIGVNLNSSCCPISKIHALVSILIFFCFWIALQTLSEYTFLFTWIITQNHSVKCGFSFTLLKCFLLLP